MPFMPPWVTKAATLGCTRMACWGAQGTRSTRALSPPSAAQPATMSLVFAVHPRVRPAADSPTLVREVRAYSMPKAKEEASGGGADCHSQAHGHWIVDTPIANPSSGFVESKTSRKSWGIDAIGTIVVDALRVG